MKWVKCIYRGSFESLTIGKIYEVLENNYGNSKHTIKIIKDDGIIEYFFTDDRDGLWFIDATSEIRDNKLNLLLNKI